MGFAAVEYEDAIRVIAEAPLHPGGWDEALRIVKAAGGGWGSQLMVLSTETGEFLLNECVDISLDIVEAFERHGGLDPTINPRCNVFLAPALKVFGDSDFLAPDARRLSSFYNDFANRADAPFIGMGRAPTPRNLSVIITAVRGARTGHIQPQEMGLFEALLPHVGAAVRLQLSLDAEANALASGTLEASNIPAFLINGWGRVVARTAQAETLLSNGRLLRLRGGKLQAIEPRNDVQLQAAIAMACRRPAPFRPPPQCTSVLLAGTHGPSLAEVAPLPLAAQAIRLGAVALVAFPKGRRSSGTAADLLRRAYGLSPAEAKTAIAIAKGDSVRSFSEARGVDVETVRTQLKGAFLKMEVASQTQLARAVFQLLGDI